MQLATLCYLQDNGRTLMLQRPDYSRRDNDIHVGKWNGLGGKFLPGESPEECARREIQEESGLHGGELCLKGFITFPMFDGQKDWYVFVFVGWGFSGVLQSSTEGSLHWIEDADLLQRPLWPGDKIFLPWLAEPRFFSAKFIYEGGVFQSHEVNFYSSLPESQHKISRDT